MKQERWGLVLSKTRLNKRASGASKGRLNFYDDKLADDIIVDLYLSAYEDKLSLFTERQPRAGASRWDSKMTDEERQLMIASMKEAIDLDGEEWDDE